MAILNKKEDNKNDNSVVADTGTMNTTQDVSMLFQMMAENSHTEDEVVQIEDYRQYALTALITAIEKQEDGSYQMLSRYFDEDNQALEQRSIRLRTLDSESTINGLIGHKVEFKDIVAYYTKDLDNDGNVIGETASFGATGYKDLGSFEAPKAENGLSKGFWDENISTVGTVAFTKHIPGRRKGDKGMVLITLDYVNQHGTHKTMDVRCDLNKEPGFSIANNQAMWGQKVSINGFYKNYRNGFFYSTKLPTQVK